MIKTSTILVLAIAVMTIAQEPGNEQVRTRQLWDTTLLQKRPASVKEPAKKPSSSSVKGALVGITIWRLRPLEPGDTRGTRALIQESDERQWVPERVSADAPLIQDQKVRVSMEAGQEGYLYIVDRDEYADGTKGDPYLIFPTTRTRHADNHVKPGMVVDVPDQDDTPPYFRVKRSRDDQIDEVLTFLITPQPLSEIKIGRDRLKLSAELVARWERLWKTKSEKLEDAASVGKAYTPAEKQAARGDVLLTTADPLPETMYHLDCKSGDPVLVDVALKIAR